MAQRTSAGAVQSVLGPDFTAKLAVQPFIDTATVVIDRLQEAAQGYGVLILDTELELIERWLAAHAYKSVDQAYSSKSTGGASGSFQGQTGKYLEGTKYGQMAVMLDPSGLLQAIASTGQESAGVIWVGKTQTEEVPYTGWN